MNWRNLRLWGLAAVLFVGGAGAVVLSTMLQRSANDMTRYVRVDVWAVQQAEYDVQQFRTAIARHVAGEATATPAIVRDLFVRARSAVPLLRRNPDFRDFGALADIDRTATSLDRALAEIEAAMGVRSDFRGDLALLKKVEASLAGPSDSLRRLATDLAHIRLELQDGDLANMKWLAGINNQMLLGFCAVALLFIGFIWSEMVRAKRAETRASEARTCLVEAIESIDEGFALYDRDDRIVLCNERFKAMFFGSAPPALIGRPITEVLQEHQRQTAPSGSRGDWQATYLAYHQNPEGLLDLRTGDGNYLQVAERKTFEGGRVATFSDFTELKRHESELIVAVQRAELANRSKTEFLANMSHELRTPLNAIIGFSEIYKAQMFGPLGAPQYAEYAGDILSSANHLLDVINDILDVSKIEAGQLELNEEEFDVGDVVTSCLRLTEERARAAGHLVAVELPDSLPTVLADRRMAKQMLLNLLSNAIKFTPNEGEIRLSAGTTEEGGLEIRVTDTGIGIAQSDMAEALATFGQVDSQLARKYEGSGLGLPLTKKLIELHGGTLELESEVDVGTSVTISFPPERTKSY